MMNYICRVKHIAAHLIVCSHACLFWSLLLVGCGSSEPEKPQSDKSISQSEPQWVEDEELHETKPQPNPFQSPEPNSSSPPLQNEIPVQKVFRPDDTRAVPDASALADFGIHKFESKRLILFTDVEPEIAKTLPPIVDQAYEALVSYFGELPPSRSGEDFQMTGYLIKDRDLILSAGLLPADLNRFDHGQHRGQEFWMYEQEHDYYRRHLLIHEVVHCYTMIMPGLRPPLWYLEGMAEFFATHRVGYDGKIEFGVMPEEPSRYRGFGRVEIIQNEVAAGRGLNIDVASRLDVNDFAASRSVPYAWSWALCKFLDAHPRYQARFRQLSNHLVGNEFQHLANSLFVKDKIILGAEWDQFARRCRYGWDFTANAFVVDEKDFNPLLTAAELVVQADQGWQSTGYTIEAHKEYVITASGRVVLDTVPRPWVSEAQGISIEYANSQPLGRLEAAVLVKPHLKEGPIPQIFEVTDCGRSIRITFENSGLLMFQVNDFPNKRSDNTGQYQVKFAPGNL